MTTTPEHTMAALCVRSDAISREKGWVNDTDERPFNTTTNLFHSELSEALEEYRANRGVNEIYYEGKFQRSDGAKTTQELSKELLRGHTGPGPLTLPTPSGDFVLVDAKPCGIPIELADFVIRVAQRVGTDKKIFEFTNPANTVDIEATDDLMDVLAKAHTAVSSAYDVFEFEGESKNPAYLGFLTGAVNLVFNFCEKHHIDLWAAIDEKEAYNRTRPFKHGNKKC